MFRTRRAANPIAVQYIWMALDNLNILGEPVTKQNIISHLLDNPTKKLNWTRELAEHELNQSLADGGIVCADQIYRMPDFVKINARKDEHDWYCFECHLPGPVISCIQCHRVFHQVCLPSDTTFKGGGKAHYICAACKQSGKTTTLSPKVVRQVIHFALDKVKRKTAWKTLGVIGYLDDLNRNNYLFRRYIDISEIAANVKRNQYRSFNDLMLDIDQLMHNVQVMYGTKDDMFTMARMLRKELEAEQTEMSLCFECYIHSRQRLADAMTTPCSARHNVIWAQRTGLSFWPNKVLLQTDEGYEVVAFGGKHERSYLPKDRACVLDINPVDLGVRMTPSLKKAVAEMETYKDRLNAYPVSNGCISSPNSIVSNDESSSPYAEKRNHNSTVEIAEEEVIETKKARTSSPLASIAVSTAAKLVPLTLRQPNGKFSKSHTKLPQSGASSHSSTPIDTPNKVAISTPRSRQLSSSSSSSASSNSSSNSSLSPTHSATADSQLTSTSCGTVIKIKREFKSPIQTKTDPSDLSSTSSSSSASSHKSSSDEEEDEHISSDPPPPRLPLAVPPPSSPIVVPPVATNNNTGKQLHSSPRSSSGVGSSSKSIGTVSPGDAVWAREVDLERKRRSELEDKVALLDSQLADLRSDKEAWERIRINLESSVAELTRTKTSLETQVSALQAEKSTWSRERLDLETSHTAAIKATKKASWCVWCHEAAKYYCCSSSTVNNSYCSQACLEAHWHDGHQHNCQRRRR